MIFGQTACFSVGETNHGTTLRLRLMRACIGPLVLALAQMSVVHPARAGGRVAMVLVAEDYAALNRSQVGIKRGNEIAEQLRARGFDVNFNDNPTNSTARVTLHEFSAKVPGTDLSLAVLIGHGTASGEQTFFLPTNAAIERSSDLRTRGLSIANIANIVSQASVGGVCFLMTSPKFANPVDGIDMRPHFDFDVAKNTVAAFSNSAKVPVSRIDAVAEFAVKEIVDLLQKQHHADLRQLVAACASQQGSVYGSPATVDLAAPVTVPPATQGKDEFTRQLEAEKAAREAAEKQAREAEARARQAQAEAREADERTRQAQAEAREADERARRPTEAETNTQSSPPATAQAPNSRGDSFAALRVLEKLLDPDTRRKAEEAKPAAEPAMTAFLNLGPESKAPDAAPIDPTALVSSVQRELKRVGCYVGTIDGQWGGKTKDALVEFARVSKSSLHTDEPTFAALEAIIGQKSRLCPLKCGTGETDVNGRCIATTRPNKPPVNKPATAPERAKHPAFTKLARPHNSSGVRDDNRSTSAVSGWYPHDTKELPFGSALWWQQKEAERGGSRHR
jgi:hypothetical protein